uniref:CF0 subunit I n=1 Tax=Corydalis ternata TaxID=2902606 RepID=UPI001E6D1AEA|nr:CF0 subunit I [Corydalis ternata]UGO88505.1 ATP synthase CF0 subunit I [Corydalis ternata]WDA92868.1 CF0 subunit I [Corydalis ternata]
MKNVTDSFVLLGYWPAARSFGFNTDIFATNPINLSAVLAVLIFFGKGVLSDLLDNRKHTILSTIRNSEERRGWAVEQMEKARAHLGKVETEAEEYRVNGYSEIDQAKWTLINATSKNLEQFKNSKNQTIQFEQQRAINQVRQRVFQQALKEARGTLNSCLNSEVHLRTVSSNVGMLRAMKEKMS